MPARPALAPGAVPRGLAGFLRLPQGKVQRVFLMLVHIHARAAFQIVQILPAQAAVMVKSSHTVVHVAIRGVSQSVIHQFLNQRDDLRDVFGRARMHSGGADTQRLRVDEVFGDKAFGQLRHGNAFLVGAANHLIVDVGKVLHKRNLVPAGLKIAAQHIKNDKRARVADVKIVIHGGAADIHADFSGCYGYKFFLFPGHAVINLHTDPP